MRAVRHGREGSGSQATGHGNGRSGARAGDSSMVGGGVETMNG